MKVDSSGNRKMILRCFMRFTVISRGNHFSKADGLILFLGEDSSGFRNSLPTGKNRTRIALHNIKNASTNGTHIWLEDGANNIAGR